MFQYFTSEQILPFIISAVFILSSVLVFKKHSRLSLALLVIGTIILGFFFANLDPFLNLWDEQYHALVAKNLAKNPLKPILYPEPILKYDYKMWSGNYIWLHKQPLFLWQIALSIKAFGVSELAVRIPSILMHATVPIFIYRMGKIISNKETGYYGALFFALAFFPLELISGSYSTDHNDVAFLFYVTGSFWAWFEYKRSKKAFWLILIGLFSGGAVLVKWLMGLLVYVLWMFTQVISSFKNEFSFKPYLPIFLSGLVSVLIFLPWQIYIHLAFPLEANYESSLNAKHFFESVENHTEPFFYYFNEGLKTLYGSGTIIPLLLLLGITFLIIKIKDKNYKIFIATSVLFVYLFFTLASTKMVSFPLIVSPFIFLGLGYLLSFSLETLRKKVSSKLVQFSFAFIAPVAIAFLLLNINKVQVLHTNKNHFKLYRALEIGEMDLIKTLKTVPNLEEYVIFNARTTVNAQIPIMFYTQSISYDFIPTQEQIRTVRAKNKKVAILNIGELPDYILADDQIKIINVEV